MALPKKVTADHIRLAMARIVETGIPSGASSTKFDVIDPVTEMPLPPKLVISIASEFANGQTYSRREFSGGNEANDFLRDLGFEIVRKNEGAQVDIKDLAPGVILTNDQLSRTFSVGNAGGMRWSGKHQCLVIIADHTKSLYDDRWVGDAFHYTGMGRVGDQTLSGQNLRLAHHEQDNVPVHLFEVFTRNAYHYAGPVRLTAPVYRESQVDDEGTTRTVLVFPLALISAGGKPIPEARDIQQIERARRRAVRPKTLEELLLLAGTQGSHEPNRRETLAIQFIRSAAVVELTKRLAQGICDLCANPAPFSTQEGPYLECHHIVHLAQGGPDTLENTVALCANCHRRMHVLDREKDVAKLKQRVALRKLSTIHFSSATQGGDL
ncbi:HNH endonuclease [Microvirga brassicacearum]|uniref:HNH endonuclease n=1 Tax=Microvirga brassicacearum TaxID=2580413 RepID=A0A5N3P4R5_9HYPH|nr:HNH endonuclease [Microvirga brassicacearum]KAB0264726.1 HNH endonuclease [Microvirga brassicacearum]